MLGALGLDDAADAVYRVLLQDRAYSVLDLCTLLGLSEDRVRRTLDELFRLALVRRSSDLADAWLAVDPQIGLQALLHQQNAELERRRAEIAASQAGIAALVAERARAESSGESGVERLIGSDAVIARIEQCAVAARTQVLGITPGGARTARDLDAARRNDAQVLERGVALREIVQDACRHDAATAAHAQWLTHAGGEVRTAPTLPQRMLVIDLQVAFIPIFGGAAGRGALQLTDPGLVRTVAALFESIWETAVPFGASAAPDRRGLTPREREVLKLLASGLTDEAVGGRLALSARTVRRIMNDLCERLDASSRFEAGIKAARAGWLDPS